MATNVYKLKVTGFILHEATNGESVQEVMAYYNRILSDKDVSKIPKVPVSEVDYIWQIGHIKD